MTVELVGFGLVSFTAGTGLLVAARAVYPRLEVTPETRSSIQFLTAVIASVLVLAGVGLVLVGLAQ
ncbi:hypothetical protein [Halopiger goleimassiliensis]|uniref:hypothetical protein n=1 Tax=Halopiger goleimassiliensis TaxID=1293048 RepID=UPI000677DF61|nr:hypothetical protein [Halopiger goleimassiliensis]